MIASDDAPSLEQALHRELHKFRVNKVNPRKEFFKIEIETIQKIIEEHHGEIHYVADTEALEYQQSINISEEDAEYIEKVFEEVEDEEKTEDEI
jgi:hypothetical protein